MFLDHLLIDKVERSVLIIIGGQRQLEDLNEIFFYDTEAEAIINISNLLFLKSKMSSLLYDSIVKSPSFAMKGVYFKEKKEILLLTPNRVMKDNVYETNFSIFLHSLGKELLLDCEVDWNSWEVIESHAGVPQALMRYASNLVSDEVNRVSERVF